MEKCRIRYGKTGNKNVQLVLKHSAAKRVKKRCCAFYHPRSYLFMKTCIKGPLKTKPRNYNLNLYKNAALLVLVNQYY